MSWYLWTGNSSPGVCNWRCTCVLLFELGLVSSWLVMLVSNSRAHVVYWCKFAWHFHILSFIFPLSHPFTVGMGWCSHFIDKPTEVISSPITEKKLDWIAFYLRVCCIVFDFQNWVAFISFTIWVSLSSSPHKIKILSKHTYLYLNKWMFCIHNWKLNFTKHIWWKLIPLHGQLPTLLECRTYTHCRCTCQRGVIAPNTVITLRQYPAWMYECKTVWYFGTWC